MTTERELTDIGANKLPKMPMPIDPLEQTVREICDSFDAINAAFDKMIAQRVEARKQWEFEQANERG